jgi:hypothetical protein
MRAAGPEFVKCERSVSPLFSQTIISTFVAATKKLRGIVALAAGGLLLGPSMGAQVALLTPAYRFATPQTVGSAAQSGTAVVTIAAAGSVNSIGVLTQGVAGEDFTLAAGGSCAAGTTYFVGQTCTVAVSFQAMYPGIRHGAAVLRASNGSVLGSELLIGTGVGPTAVFVPGVLNTAAGNGQWIYRGDGGQATASPLFLPMGGAADAAGDLYLSDSNNQRVRLVNATTQTISTVAGDGTAGFGGDGGPAMSALLNTPADVKLDGAGNFYIADSANHAIRMVNAATGIIYTIAGVGGQSGYSGDGGQATLAHLAYPSGIAFDGDHALYISDTGNNVLRKVDLSTGIITTVAGTGVAGYSGDGGAATQGQLNYPWGITVAGDGSLYIADLSNNRVRKVSTAGVLTTAAGNGARGYSGDGGAATAAQLNVPAGVLVDVAGNLYVADSGNQLVRKVSATTGVISTIAGIPGGGAAVDGLAANMSPLDGPYAMFMDGPGNLYIADMFHQLIRILSSSATSLSFPEMRVGRVSAPQPVTLENDGNAALSFSAFNLVSNSALDGGSTTCVTGQPVAVDLTCVMGVEFAPTTTGTLVTGSLSAVSTASDSPSTVYVSGQVISVQPTTAVLTSSTNPAALGAAVTFTVVISNSLPVAPTGTVNFLDGTTVIGSGTLNGSGVATYSTATLTTGSHSITAVYAGDSQNNAATSPALSQSVRQPTTTVLASSLNPAIAAAAVTFTATVTGPNGSLVKPGGTVTFFDGATSLGVGSLNAAGVATLTTSGLNGGQHSITADYGGDSQDLASQSVVFVETMVKATTTSSVTTSNVNVAAGTSLTFTSTVTRTDGVIATGTVTFLDNGTAIGTGTLNSAGAATFTTTALSGGVHTITASYGGDASNLASISPALTETVQALATGTTIAASANPAVAGAMLQLTATVTQSAPSGSGGAFSGTVTFLDGGTAVGTASVSAAGIATLSVTTLGVGGHTLTASFGGSANYMASVSGTLAESIAMANTATALSSSIAPSIAGMNVVLTASVTGNGGIATGTVKFLDGTTVIGSGALNGSGVATLSTSALAVGTHGLTATFSGDGKDNGSTSVALTQVVQIASTTTALTASTNPSTFGASITFTASVSTNGGAATGAVTFSDGSTVLGTAAVSGGTAVYSSSTFALGGHTITAAYGGDANDAPSTSAAVMEQVLQAGPVTLASSANPSTAGTSVALTATIAAPQGAAVTGTVTFKDGAVTLGTVNAGGAGVATLNTAALAVGQHTIVAVYSGDASNRGGSSNNLVQVVQTAGTSVTVGSSANPATAGTPLTLTAAVTGTGGTVTGNVTFQDGTTVLGTSSVNGSGIASLTVANLVAGKHTIIAVYGGDANDVPSTSVAYAETVVQATTVALSSSENPALAMDAVTFTAVVSNGGSTTPTGTVVFSDAGKTLGTVVLSGAGVATFAATSLATGQHTITAAYGGDTLNLASVSATLTEPVQLRATSDTLTGSSTSLTGGQQVTLISVVRYSGPVAPTGAVTFVSDGTTLGTSVVDNTGVATLTVNLLTSPPTVTASYSGDAVYEASTSPQADIVVAKPTQFTMQLNPSAVTLQSKQNSTTTLTITSVNGFTDTLDLGCLGLPFAATCTFATDKTALAANGTQTIQVVVDTGSPLTAGSVARLEQRGTGSMAMMCSLPGGALLGLMFWKGRRRMRSGLGGLLFLLMLAAVSTGLTGCGGLNINGTPPGTYVFQVSATGVGTGVSQTIDVTLTVAQ